MSLFADDEECNFYYAQLLHKMGNYNDAKYHFKRALLLQKRPYIWHYFEYALLLSEMKNFEEAIKHFEICINLNANVAKVNYEYGLFLFENNIDKEKGLKLIKKSSEINPAQLKYEETLNRISYSADNEEIQDNNKENLDLNDDMNNSNLNNKQQIIIGNNSNHNIINIQNYGYEKNECNTNNIQNQQSNSNKNNIIINMENNNTVFVKNDEMNINNNNVVYPESNHSHDTHHSIIDRIIADFEVDLGMDIGGNNNKKKSQNVNKNEDNINININSNINHDTNHDHQNENVNHNTIDMNNDNDNNNNHKIYDYETKEEEKDDIILKYSNPDILAVNEFKRILTEYIFGFFEFEEEKKDTGFIQSLQIKINEYYNKFANLSINDIRLLEFIDRKTLEHKIGMHSKHIDIFFKNLKKFKNDCNDFIQFLKNLDLYNDYYDAFETYGIITFSSFGYHCKTVQDIVCIINKGNKSVLLNMHNQKHHCDALRMIEKYNALFSHYI